MSNFILVVDNNFDYSKKPVVFGYYNIFFPNSDVNILEKGYRVQLVFKTLDMLGGQIRDAIQVENMEGKYFQQFPKFIIKKVDEDTN